MPNKVICSRGNLTYLDNGKKEVTVICEIEPTPYCPKNYEMSYLDIAEGGPGLICQTEEVIQ